MKVGIESLFSEFLSQKGASIKIFTRDIEFLRKGTSDASKATVVNGVAGCTEVNSFPDYIIFLSQLIFHFSSHTYFPALHLYPLQVACGTAVSYAVTEGGKLYR